ncbi:MAG: hypothetical protein ACYCTD_08075 [bacterium]
MERTLELKLKEKNIDFSPERIKEALNSMNFASVEINKERFLIKTKPLELGNKILNSLRIKHPKNLTPFAEVNLP